MLPVGPAAVLFGPFEVRQHRHGAVRQPRVGESWAQVVPRRLLEDITAPHQLANLIIFFFLILTLIR